MSSKSIAEEIYERNEHALIEIEIHSQSEAIGTVTFNKEYERYLFKDGSYLQLALIGSSLPGVIMGHFTREEPSCWRFTVERKEYED